VAYLGEFNSGASAVSIPILNEAGIMQISPSNTYVGLTRSEGACCGEPARYYPSGSRHYGRVTPPDHTQAHALLAYARDRGRKRIALVHDGEVYGEGLARLVQSRAAAYGIETVTFAPYGRSNARAIARLIRRRKADAMMFGGITQNRAVALWGAVHRRNRKIDLYGPDGVAESSFTERIPRSSRSRTFITNPTLHPFAYPQAGKDFFNRFQARFGRGPEPYAIYGYEAMALALDALARGGNTRAGAITALFATRDRASVLGTYSIDENGDTTLADYGGYRVSARGVLAFSKVLVARP
jgi:branched-chain amino acid transport system substrate-binding protein